MTLQTARYRVTLNSAGQEYTFEIVSAHMEGAARTARDACGDPRAVLVKSERVTPFAAVEVAR